METVLLPGKQVRRGGLRHHLGSVTFITTGERIGSAALKVCLTSRKCRKFENCNKIRNCLTLLKGLEKPPRRNAALKLTSLSEER
jgi:hypothetical protein